MDQFGNYSNENENNQEYEDLMKKYNQDRYGIARDESGRSVVYGEHEKSFSGGSQPPHHSNHPQGRPPHPRGGGRVYVMAILLALLASIFGTIATNTYFDSQEEEVEYVLTETVVMYQSAITTTTASSDATYASVAAAVADTVVEIYTEEVSSSRFGQYVTEGAGSGVIISTDGYIITNNHVIEGATTVYVRLTDGSTYVAEVIGSDSDEDIAVLKIDATDLQAAVFADSDELVVGEEVIAVGNPLGELGGSVTNGIISALDREIEVDGVMMTLLQTNAAINPGNSGGGLFNMDGELVGIVNAKNTGEDIDNIGFCIPSNNALSVATDLIEVGYVTGKPALGISIYSISSTTEARQYGFSMAGVYIVESTNSLDLEYGDLLLAVDDVEISSSDDISTALTNKEVGDTVTVTVLRDREVYTIEVTLVEYTG